MYNYNHMSKKTTIKINDKGQRKTVLLSFLLR